MSIVSLRRALHVSALLLMAVSTADAAALRFVVSNGKDANPCSRTAPCRTLQRGHDATPAGGTLLVLGTGGYGASLAITKSITITAEGVAATLGKPGNVAIDAPGAVVVLRGLLLSGDSGGPAGVHGVNIVNAAAVYVENCVIERFTGRGVTMSTPTSTELFVADSVMRHNGQGGLSAQGGSAELRVERSRFERNGSTGVSVFAGAESVITDSSASGHNIYGFSVSSGGQLTLIRSTAVDSGLSGFVASGSGSELTVEYSAAHRNGRGLQVESSSGDAPNIAIVSNSVFTENDTGIQNSAGGTSSILSRGNNTVSGNTTEISGTITPLDGE